MSYTPSNISDIQSTVYGSSKSGLLPVWQSARIAFDARTGFFVEYKVNSDFTIRIKIPRFRAVSELVDVLVRALYAFDFILNKKLSFTSDSEIHCQLKDLVFPAISSIELLPIYYRKVQATFGSKLDLIARILCALQGTFTFDLKSFANFKPGVIIPNGILTQPGENASNFDLDTNRIAGINPATFDGVLEFSTNTRSIVPVKAVVLPDFTSESHFDVDQLIPNKKPTFLSDEYIQPIGYEYVNQYRVVLVTFKKFLSLFFNTVSLIHWINAVAIRRIETLEFNSISDFRVKGFANIFYMFVKIFDENSLFSIFGRLTRRVFATIMSLSSFMVINNIYIKGIYPDEFLEDSHFEFIDTTPIKRRVEFTFNLLSVFSILITFWRDGRPAIRVTTLQHDILRKPRGMIVILEDPTL